MPHRLGRQIVNLDLGWVDALLFSFVCKLEYKFTPPKKHLQSTWQTSVVRQQNLRRGGQLTSDVALMLAFLQ